LWRPHRESVVEAFLAHVEEALQRDQSDTLRETRVVSEYEDIFQDILSLPPLGEVCVELQLGTTPISHAPYYMAPIEMREPQTQHEELRAQGFIRQSHSTWGALVLFVKKKDNTFACALSIERTRSQFRINIHYRGFMTYLTSCREYNSF